MDGCSISALSSLGSLVGSAVAVVIWGFLSDEHTTVSDLVLAFVALGSLVWSAVSVMEVIHLAKVLSAIFIDGLGIPNLAFFALRSFIWTTEAIVVGVEFFLPAKPLSAVLGNDFLFGELTLFAFWTLAKPWLTYYGAIIKHILEFLSTEFHFERWLRCFWILLHLIGHDRYIDHALLLFAILWIQSFFAIYFNDDFSRVPANVTQILRTLYAPFISFISNNGLITIRAQ